jgi:phosphatidylinositol glycan class P protein
MPPQSRGKTSRITNAFATSPPGLSDFTQLQALPTVSPERTPTTANPQYDVSDLASPEPASSASEDDDADFQSHYALDRQSLSSSSSSGDDISAGRRPSLPHSHSSFLGPHAFAPPFYGRPPTPLPPSPSLASLLGPPFSTTTSRPTTPDSSDNETPNDTEAAVAKSARIATTVPRASPKVPTYEYYGFALYLASTGAFRKHIAPVFELV